MTDIDKDVVGKGIGPLRGCVVITQIAIVELGDMRQTVGFIMIKWVHALTSFVKFVTWTTIAVI